MIKLSANPVIKWGSRLGLNPTIFTGLMALSLLTACENDPVEVALLTKTAAEVEVGTDIEAVMSQTANLKAILKAPIMYRVKTDTIFTEFPQSIFVTFYSDSATAESVVKAKYAKYYEMLRKVYMRDSVVVYNFKGDTLFAEDLWWDQNLEIFYSNLPVKVRQPSQNLTGSGITAKTDFSQQTIRDPKGDVEVPRNFGSGPVADTTKPNPF
jgi:LPS export ABC transporter protein LptC